jgi:hypothetical protein
MSMPQELFQRVSRQAWWKSFPFLLALLVRLSRGNQPPITYPNDGLRNSSASVIEELLPAQLMVLEKMTRSSKMGKMEQVWPVMETRGDEL